MSGPISPQHDYLPPPPGEFIGHPKPLWMLFAAEFWERFSYYGMRALLAVYVASTFFGLLPEGEANAAASLTYGAYTALVYATAIFGGYIADRYLGYQRSIMLGGALMAAGMFLLLIENLTGFLIGLAVIVVGNGLFKPNISTMVGKLYAPGDPRRDSGFTIFYMGINAGALIAPIICGAWIGALYGFKWGFFVAGLGMVFGIVVFQILSGWLGHVGKPPPGAEGFGRTFKVLGGALLAVPVVYFLLSQSTIAGYILMVMMLGLAVYFITRGIRRGDKVQMQRYIAMLILFFANMVFWALFEQAGSSLNFLARDYVDAPFHFSLFQSANPVFILILAPVFAAMWPRLEKHGMNPSIPRKFAFGLLGAALGFLVLVLAIKAVAVNGGKIPWIMLALCYLVQTMGELCLSPIGLSMVTKLAAPKEVGMAMGGWFLSIAMANFLAGAIASVASGGGGHGEAASGLDQYLVTFNQLIWLGCGAAVVFFLFAPMINKLMHGVK